MAILSEIYESSFFKSTAAWDAASVAAVFLSTELWENLEMALWAQCWLLLPGMQNALLLSSSVWGRWMLPAATLLVGWKECACSCSNHTFQSVDGGPRFWPDKSGGTGRLSPVCPRLYLSFLLSIYVCMRGFIGQACLASCHGIGLLQVAPASPEAGAARAIPWAVLAAPAT